MEIRINIIHNRSNIMTGKQIGLIVLGFVLDLAGVVSVIAGLIILASGGQPWAFIIGGVVSIALGAYLFISTIWKGGKFGKMFEDFFSD